MVLAAGRAAHLTVAHADWRSVLFGIGVLLLILIVFRRRPRRDR